MKLFSFKGGVHPAYNKELSKDAEIIKAGVPEMQLIFTPMIWRLMERRKQALAR